MATANHAVLAIRHVVQDHGDEHTRIGSPAELDGVAWFGRLLGWEWPCSYLAVLEKHDGVHVRHADLYSFLESIEVFLIFHDRWHKPLGFWPVSSDGCGNYYALSLDERDPAGECPVVFFEIINSSEEPLKQVADSYTAFVVRHLAQECKRVRCREWRNITARA